MKQKRSTNFCSIIVKKINNSKINNVKTKINDLAKATIIFIKIKKSKLIKNKEISRIKKIGIVKKIKINGIIKIKIKKRTINKIKIKINIK